MFNMKKNHKIHKLSTIKTKLSEIQITLLAFDFELIEIWSPDEGNNKEVWFNKKKNKTIEISVLEDDDAKRNDVVGELIDIWIELKDLKDSILLLLSEDDELPQLQEPTPSMIFENEVNKTKFEWVNNEEEVKFLYNKNIDPSVLTYLKMSDEEKQKVAH